MNQINYTSISGIKAWLGILSLATVISMGALADAKALSLQIARQPTGSALIELAQASGVQIIFSADDMNGVVSPAIGGEFTVAEAVDALLKGTGFAYQQVSDSMIVVKQAVAADKAETSSNAGEKLRSRVIDEVIVTAQKREQSLYDVPISILAIGAEEIEVRKITDWADLALAVPGLKVAGDIQRKIYMRGLGSFVGSSSMVGIYVDDISVSSGPQHFQLDTRVHDVERVEVLRGPQGTLYGQGSMAGTIRFITKDPQLDGFGFGADVEASFTEDGSPSQRTQAVVNIPLIEDKLGLRISGTFEHAGGWIDQGAGRQEDINDQNVSNLRVKGLWRPTERLTAKATAIVHRNEFGFSDEQADGNNPPAFDVFTPSVSDDEYELYNLTLSYDFGDVNFLSTSSYVNRDVLNSDVGYTYSAFHTMLDPFFIKGTTFTQEVRLSSTGLGRLQWTLGGLYEDVEGDSGLTLFAGPPGPLPPPSLSTLASSTNESWAVFGNVNFALTPRFEIGGGLRYFEDDRRQEAFTNDVLVGTFEDSYEALSPRAYANFDITGDVKLYSSVAKGFRSGGRATFNLTEGQPGFGPETVWTYELGAKGASFDGQFIWDVAGFYTDYSDVVVQVLSPSSSAAELFAPLEINAGDAEIWGMEGSFTWHLQDNFRVGMLGTWLDTEYTSVIGTQRPKLPGDKLDFIPDYQFTVWAEQDFILASRSGLIRVDYNQQDSTEFSNRFSGTFDGSEVINMLNLHVTWQWDDNLHVGLFGRNLLNDRDAVDPIGIGKGDPPKYIRSRPRTIGVEFGVDF